LVTQIKLSQVAEVREQLLQQQTGLCALCQEIVEPGKAVLDHDHKSGLIRGVLHRGCNALEGTIANSLPRNLITPARLAKIFQNWDQYHANPADLLHPGYRTAEQRKIRAKKRAKARKKGNT
jgi:hypothetical protein